MADYLTPANLFYALSGGFIPSLFWLWFWLKEDRHPEPRVILLMTFLAGMLMVPVAMILEYLILKHTNLTGVTLIAAWALVEELVKYEAAKKVALVKKWVDEPIDAIIYMITAALGFASLENALFISKSFLGGDALSGIDIGNMRFIGATLLHVATSAIIGSALAFSFTGSPKKKINFKKTSLVIGFALAWLLHFVFNYLIIESKGENVLKNLIPLWIIIIAIIFIIEKVRRLTK